MTKSGGIPFGLKPVLLSLVLLLPTKSVGAGEVKGRVEYVGPRLQEEWVPVQKNREVCGAWRPLERLLLSPEGGVANVLVRLEGVQGQRPGLSPRVAVLDNRDCRFMPRVQIARVGTILEIRYTGGSRSYRSANIGGAIAPFAAEIRRRCPGVDADSSPD